MRVGIVGNGVVGSAMARFISGRSLHEVVIYDKFQSAHNAASQREAINACDLVFLCMPTPADGQGACDVSAVEECAAWIRVPICIRSTVVPGTTDRLSATAGVPIAFSPEYLGESPDHPWHEEAACGFLIVGGPDQVADLVLSLYGDCAPPGTRYYRTTARTAELCKYMENCFLATKVAFVNQFCDIAAAMGVDFAELRELWLADPRVGTSHTLVTAERGFRGRCLPKDVAALIAAMALLGGAPLLEAVQNYNSRTCAQADQERGELSSKCAR